MNGTKTTFKGDWKGPGLAKRFALKLELNMSITFAFR